MTTGIFGLKKVYKRQRLETWEESANYGYFAGGDTPSVVCTIDRIDFSTETVSLPVNNLTQAKRDLSAVSNSNYGYFGGGEAPPVALCTIDRLDFSNETVAAPGTYQLTEARSLSAALSNSNYGYFAGGGVPPASPVTRFCTIDRLDFSNETVSAPGKNLTQARSGLAAVSNSNYGYFGGGYIVSTIDRLDFTTETVSTPAPTLTQARRDLASISGGSRINARKVRVGITTDNVPISSTYGYFGGGSAPPNVSTIDRLDFSTETIQYPVIDAKLTQERLSLAAVSNSNYGYFGGGGQIVLPPVCTIDRLDFTTETVSTPAPTLTQARTSLAAVSN